MSEISMIVPVYNVEPYICRCIDSILSQTFTDIDVVLVDDGSPDRCGTICDDYAQSDPRIHVIHQKNGGLSAARNAGIEWALTQSGSRWISFVDSDDWIHPRFIEILLSAVQKDKTEIAIGGALWSEGENLPEEVSEDSVLWKTEDYYAKEPTNATVTWGKLYKKTCFSSIRFPVGRIHEDEYVTYKILFECKYISVVDSPLYAYYQNPAGIMKSKWSPGRLDALEAIEEQIKFFSDRGLTDIAKRRFFVLIRKASENQGEILQCPDLTEKERRKYLHRVKRVRRRILFRYRNYKWLPFGKNANSKQLYTDTFYSIYLGREIWGRIKAILKRIPGIPFLGRKILRVWVRREDIRTVLLYMRKTSFKKVILLQSPLHGNLGDHAISKAEGELLEKSGISFCDFPWTKGIEKWCAAVTPKHKIILISGGGFAGSLWPNEEDRIRATIQSYDKNHIILMPQTIFFDMTSENGRRYFEVSRDIYEGHPDLTVYLREKYSLRFMKKHMPKVRTELVPDMVMCMKWSAETKNRNGALVCLRKDKERTLSEEDHRRIICLLEDKYDYVLITDTVLQFNISPEKREQWLSEKLNEFAAASIVITDRLHGMIFAAITETPCIVVNSLSPKIRGCYEWLKELDYIGFAEDIDTIPSLLDSVSSVVPHYDAGKIEELMQPLFDELQKN